jgi:hypothetical protein
MRGATMTRKDYIPPCPLRVLKVGPVIRIVGSGGGSIAQTNYLTHAEFIVTACNAHAALLKALQAIANGTGYYADQYVALAKDALTHQGGATITTGHWICTDSAYERLVAQGYVEAYIEYRYGVRWRYMVKS